MLRTILPGSEGAETAGVMGETVQGEGPARSWLVRLKAMAGGDERSLLDQEITAPIWIDKLYLQTKQHRWRQPAGSGLCDPTLHEQQRTGGRHVLDYCPAGC